MQNTIGIIYKRPWGSYETLVISENYQVKKIIVKPGQKLSFQKHFKRSEHWIIIEGTPIVTLGDNKKEFMKNDHIFIPKEYFHRIENQNSHDVVFIEVQHGEYLGEDDIVRIDDIYGRE